MGLGITLSVVAMLIFFFRPNLMYLAPDIANVKYFLSELTAVVGTNSVQMQNKSIIMATSKNKPCKTLWLVALSSFHTSCLV